MTNHVITLTNPCNKSSTWSVKNSDWVTGKTRQWSDENIHTCTNCGHGKIDICV